MQSRLFAIPMLAFAIVSCGPAKAETVDVSNPFHCGVAFSVYYGIAKSTGNSAMAMLEQRMKAEAAKAAALPASERTRAEGEALSKRLTANPDKAYETVAACMKRQDAERAGS